MSVLRKILNWLLDSGYRIGFVENYTFPEAFDNSAIKWMDTSGYPGKNWFADPFILEADDNEIILLAEEWEAALGHGRISKLRVSRKDFELLEVHPILQLDTHLSFPYTVRHDGKIYVIPENYQSGSVKIYTYDTDADKLVNPKILLDEPLLDVQLFQYDGRFYLTGVEFKTATQDDTKTLRVYQADNLFGPYEFTQTITNEKCEERGAGLIFMHEGKLIRPAQCCNNNEYGTAVIFKELCFEGEHLTQSEILRINRAKRLKNGLVLHTFNQPADTTAADTTAAEAATTHTSTADTHLTAVDGFDYTLGTLGRMANKTKKLFSMI